MPKICFRFRTFILRGLVHLPFEFAALEPHKAEFVLKSFLYMYVILFPSVSLGVPLYKMGIRIFLQSQGQWHKPLATDI